VGQSRKTIAPQDVFQALEELEFGEFRGRLEMELARELRQGVCEIWRADK
jgi:DNA polymerase epsilon subunit 3